MLREVVSVNVFMSNWMNYIFLIRFVIVLVMNVIGNFIGCLRVKCLFIIGERVVIVIFFSVIFIVFLVGNCILFVVIICNK